MVNAQFFPGFNCIPSAFHFRLLYIFHSSENYINSTFIKYSGVSFRTYCYSVRIRTFIAALCRARVLYDGGIESVALLAAAAPADVENILHSARPFQTAKDPSQLRYTKINVCSLFGATKGVLISLIYTYLFFY